jgi:ketosteroid isomerase-like protein
MRSISVVIACAIFFVACAREPVPDPVALGRQILEAEAAEATGWAERDLDKIMNAYAPDALVLLGGAPVDREQLRKLFVNFLKDPGFLLTFRSDPPLMTASGDIGITIGTYQVTFTDQSTQSPVTKNGYHLMSWQRQHDGEWRVLRPVTRHDD